MTDNKMTAKQALEMIVDMAHMEAHEYASAGGGRRVSELEKVIRQALSQRVPDEAVASHHEAFEAFYSKQLERNKYSETFTRSGGGYLVGHTQRAWLAWCYGAHHQTQLLEQSRHLPAQPADSAKEVISDD